MNKLIGIAALAATAPGLAQDSGDEAAIQARIDAIYAVISGPVGEQRDWDAMRSMMTENATLTPIGPDGPLPMNVDGYIERSEKLLMDSGFHELETGNRIEIFGNLAHVWSAYEGRAASHDGDILVTGINSFQLIKMDGEWKVNTILWQPAGPDLPVPADLAAEGVE